MYAYIIAVSRQLTTIMYAYIMRQVATSGAWECTAPPQAPGYLWNA